MGTAPRAWRAGTRDVCSRVGATPTKTPRLPASLFPFFFFFFFFFFGDQPFLRARPTSFMTFCRSSHASRLLWAWFALGRIRYDGWYVGITSVVPR